MEKYIYHITTNTGHARKSPRSEVSKYTAALLKPWIEEMIRGKLRAIVNERYFCRVVQHNSKMIELVISRLNDNFKQIDLVRFVICNHSRKKIFAWNLVGGKGDAPNVPFCAVQLLTENFEQDDFPYTLIFADFERCIAWGWLDMIEDEKEIKRLLCAVKKF